MFKKGLVTLVCLTVMSALWSWATTSYSVQTNIAPLGTYDTGTKTADGKPIYAPVIGGSVKIRTLAVGDSIAAKDWATHTGGTKTASVLTTQTVEVDVDAADGYKIGSVYKTTYSIVNGIPVKNTPVLITPLDGPEFHTETIVDQDPFGRTQILDVTFVPKTTDGGNPLNWQLQVQNNNIGGSILVNRGVAGQATYLNQTVSTIGKPWIKNFLDDGKVTLTVSAAPGYKIDYITKNGVKTFLAGNDVSEVVELAGTINSRIKSLNVGYKKLAIPVTTHDGATVTYPVLGGGTQTIAKDYGILPINPVADPYGVVRLIVTPTANQNKVNSITVETVNPLVDGAFAGTVKYFDRFGTEIAVPGSYIGAVKVTISKITKPIKVTAAYGLDAAVTPAYTNCTQTCHIDPSLAADVKTSLAASDTEWKASAHRASGVDCVSCHKSMPGTDLTVAATKAALCSTCHTGDDAAHITANASRDCNACHNTSHNPKAVKADDYVGSATCGVCHTGEYATFVNSGHNFKMNKVVGTTIPDFPFSDDKMAGALEAMPGDTALGGATVNSLGKPTSYGWGDNQSPYIVGGYYYKARWFDKDGYLVTGKKVQYNLQAGAASNAASWSDYEPTSVNKKYNCGECHVTGWKYDADGYGQDGLHGMYGTWVESGVQCEACHGAGKAHAKAPAASNITKNAAARTSAELAVNSGYGLPIACGECHTRDGERNAYGGEGSTNDSRFLSKFNQDAGTTGIGGRIRAKDGIGQHHQAYDELLGVDPTTLSAVGKHLKAGVSCATCHDSHKNVVYNGGGVKLNCVDCHTVTFNASAHAGTTNADCIKCHMPLLAKNAIGGTNLAGEKTGDMNSHIFKIDLSATDQYTVYSGSGYTYPRITKKSACGTCHGTSATANGATKLITEISGAVHGSVVYKHTEAAKTANPANASANCQTCHSPTKATGAFVGASNCQSCHSEIHTQWKDSWHTLKAKKGPALLGGSLENINPWAQANWASLKTYQILGRKYNNSTKNYSEFWVSVDKKPITDVAVVIGQARKQRYAVYFSGAAQRAKVVYSNNGGITYREKMVDHDNDPGTPTVWEEVDMPAQPDRAGYMFLWLEVQLDQNNQATAPVTNGHNYEEWRSWQERCTACHTTGFDRVAYNSQMAAYKTAFAALTQAERDAGVVPAGIDMRNLFITEWEISCEACHGAGQGHNVVSPAKLNKAVAAEAQTRRMVCESCHTRTNTNLQADIPAENKTANDRRGFKLGDATNGVYFTWMDYTSPAWGTGNRQVSIDGKGRRDHQMTMDIQLSKYIHEVIEGKPTYHGTQNCFDCHKSHDVGLYKDANGNTVNQLALNLVNNGTNTYNMYNLKTTNPASGVATEFRLKDTRAALCKSCHVDGVAPEGALPAGLTITDVPQFASIQALFNVFNSDTSPSGYGFPHDGTLATYDGVDATALVANALSNWGGQTSGGVGATNGRGGRKSHLFNTNVAAANPNKAFGLAPEEYTWEIDTAKVGLLNTVAGDYKAIWPWLNASSGKTKVYGPLTNLGSKPPVASRPYQP